MPQPIKAVDESRYRLEYMIGNFPKEQRPAIAIVWAQGQLVRAVHLILNNPGHCIWFEQHDLLTHQDQHLSIATPEFVEAARRSNIKFEVIEEVE